ncbi:DUF1648 domain-containing protein [Streptomyces sp. AK02-01A]|uniref:DUF1648 domain-containing protein n=1 Tax=Streptomyces sp. AK02-01A TaxID=3028648 RepID=UPI0029B6B6FC|nr:DUF1648 domain-containing protein [Streptomyces sp. AK02-01A]MDX3853410.1 DUF1648 domain-containing protein [Streptomyces sp. AK02-01A]
MNGPIPALGPKGRAALAVLPGAVACAGMVAVAVARWDAIPDPIAIHFADGGADGFAPRAVGILGMVAFCVLETVLFAVVAYRRPAARHSLYATVFAVQAALGCAFVVTLLANAAVADAERADWSGWRSLAPIGAALAGAAVGALLAPASAGRGATIGSPLSVGLAATETAVWSRSASSARTKGVFTALIAAGVAGVLFDVEELAWLGLPLGLIGLVMSLMRASVSANGFALRLPLLPFPRVTVPLEDIRQAHVRLVSPMGDLGGWGYRSMGGRRGLAFHSGEGLWLELANDLEFLIVIEDAESAAGLINDLLARSAGER